MRLEISLFKFDCKSDYLPFYTKHFLKIENEKNLLDILNTINNEQTFGYENCENFDLVVNGVYAKASITINELVENFGKELTIEPVSIRRAHTDLLINEDDFNKKVSILTEFIDQDDFEEYKNLKQYYYASNTLNYHDDYVGDAVLILAAKLIEKHPKAKNKILQKLSEEDISASYHTSLEKRIYNFDSSIEESIVELQKSLRLVEDIEKQNFRVDNTLIINFGEFEDNQEIKHDFKDFTLAYYNTNDKASSLINKLNANVLNLDSLKLDLAKNTFNKNNIISFDVVTTILLDAFDNNADFLVVDNDEDFYLFDYNRKSLEKKCGRDVLLPVIHVNELEKLASGNHSEAKKTLEKHQVNPEII